METDQIPYGFIKDDKIYLSAWGEYGERVIGEVRDGDIQTSSNFFVTKFSEFEKKVYEVIQKIEEAENKGSFLMKLVHLKEQVVKHDGLGDYEVLLNRINQYEALVKDIIQQNRKKNTELKKVLIQEADQIAELLNWKESTEKINDLKKRWIKTGNAEEEVNQELEDEFWAKVSNFFDRKKEFYEDKKRLLESRKEEYEAIILKADQVAELYGNKQREYVSQLKAEWRDIGGIPAEMYTPLNEAFQKKLRPPRKKPAFDYKQIAEMVREVLEERSPYNREELELIKKNLMRDKRYSPEKKQILKTISLISERDFVDKLARKRFADFAKMDQDKKRSIKVNIVRDLISRDKEVLQTYEENSANFSTVDGKMNKMIEGKINGQKKKIEIKIQLLELFRSQKN